MNTLIELLFCHFLGDYFLQIGFIADSKGSNWYHLFVHCMLYMLPFYICFGLTWQFYVILGLHFMIDAAKARFHLINYACDQALHIALLLLYCL